jgi:kynurenine 3-monooxygenase
MGSPNVKVLYNRKLIQADLESKVAVFADAAIEGSYAEENYTRVEFDLLIGADGAHSAVRHQMAKYAQINLSQTWLDTWWCEFLICQSEDGKPKINLDTLHVWPQQDSMFLALPNPVSVLALSERTMSKFVKGMLVGCSLLLMVLAL